MRSAMLALMLLGLNACDQSCKPTVTGTNNFTPCTSSDAPATTQPPATVVPTDNGVVVVREEVR